MASCSSVIGLVIILLIALASAIALATPYWIHSSTFHAGLWQECGGSDKCTFINVNATNLPKWFNPVRIVMAVSVANSLVAFLVAMGYLCCGCCKNAIRAVQFLILVLFVGCLELIGSVVVYAVKHEDVSFYSTLTGDSKLGWSFYMAAATVIGYILAIVLYVCETGNAVRSQGSEYAPILPTSHGRYETIPPTSNT